MKQLVEVYKGLSFLFTQTKLTVISIEKCLIKSEYINEIQFDEEFYNRTPFSNSIRALLSNYSVIQFCSFLDEYKKFNQTLTDNESLKARIRKVRDKNKYGLKRINKWTNLYDIRNQLLAHNFQIKNKSFFDNEENKVYEYSFPDTLNEKLVFLKIMEKICMNIIEEFDEILLISNIAEYKMSEHIKINKGIIDLETEMNEIEKQM
ncbi:hypothetical protein [Kaistella polysaccharea]|uniref:hypothetical protein n=1 Tax=Kaistella polysaccharea TaxID=2878534 RepID=UPI001CF44475|nr:hypothetical protein [Kaistella polysaccharea]